MKSSCFFIPYFAVSGIDVDWRISVKIEWNKMEILEGVKKLNKRSFGKSGERLAEEYLSQTGYRILCRNYWCRMGEIDIVAQKDGVVHFVEVKTRSSGEYGRPSESVTRRKTDRMRQVAESYMKAMAGMPGLGKKMQFDVIEIEVRQIENISL